MCTYFKEDCDPHYVENAEERDSLRGYEQLKDTQKNGE